MNFKIILISFITLLASTNSFAKKNYFDYLVASESGEEVVESNTDSDDDIMSGYEEMCRDEYRVAKQTYLSEKAIFDSYKDHEKNSIYKSATVMAAGIIGAIIGHNNGSRELEYISLGVAAVGAGSTIGKTYQYIKNDKILKPSVPYYCEGKLWDATNIDKQNSGLECEQVDYFMYDNFNRQVQFKTFICGSNEIEEAKFYNGEQFCSNCN